MSEEVKPFTQEEIGTFQQMESIGSTLAPRRWLATLAARDQRIRQLEDDSPGTPLGRLHALSTFAEEECGHNPMAAMPPEVTICEYVQALKADVERLERTNKRLTAENMNLNATLSPIKQRMFERDPMNTATLGAALAEMTRLRLENDRLTTERDDATNAAVQECHSIVCRLSPSTDAIKDIIRVMRTTWPEAFK